MKQSEVDLSKETIVIVIKALDENLDPESDDFLYACIVLMCNFTWNVGLVARTLECSWKDVIAVRVGINNARLRKGYADFLFYEGVGMNEVVEFWLVVLMIKGEVMRVEVDKGLPDQIASVHSPVSEKLKPKEEVCEVVLSPTLAELLKDNKEFEWKK
jgi:hypothetical protein